MAQRFDATAYGPAVAALLADDRLPSLGPGAANAALRPALAALRLDVGARDPDMARACHAGLWLLHDFLEESHALSQEIATPEGSFWHGILHRREPDAANASYWFRRVGEHPIFPLLAQDAQELGLRLPSGRWDPFAFIDLCEQHRDTGSEREMLLRRVQQREWEHLFAWCYTHSVAGC